MTPAQIARRVAMYDAEADALESEGETEGAATYRAAARAMERKPPGERISLRDVWGGPSVTVAKVAGESK
jgi:hypothetical protein